MRRHTRGGGSPRAHDSPAAPAPGAETPPRSGRCLAPRSVKPVWGSLTANHRLGDPERCRVSAGAGRGQPAPRATARSPPPAPCPARLPCGQISLETDTPPAGEVGRQELPPARVCLRGRESPRGTAVAHAAARTPGARCRLHLTPPSCTPERCTRPPPGLPRAPTSPRRQNPNSGLFRQGEEMHARTRSPAGGNVGTCCTHAARAAPPPLTAPPGGGALLAY